MSELDELRNEVDVPPFSVKHLGKNPGCFFISPGSVYGVHGKNHAHDVNQVQRNPGDTQKNNNFFPENSNISDSFFV